MLVGNCVHQQNPDKSAGKLMHCYDGPDAHRKALAYLRALWVNVGTKEASDWECVPPDDPRSGVYLVHHATTKLDDTGRVQGWLDNDLDKGGRKEAKQIAKEFEGVPLAPIHSSDLRRTSHTAEIISKKLGVPFAGSSKVYRTWNLGQLQAHEGDYANPIIAQYVRTPNVPVPGGESFNDFRGRVTSAISKAVGETPPDAKQNRAIVTHHRVMILAQAAQKGKLDVDKYIHGDIPKTGVVKLVQSGVQWKHKETTPLNLRESTGAQKCLNCRYYDRGQGEHGLCEQYDDYPVDDDDVCDTWSAKGKTMTKSTGGNLLTDFTEWLGAKFKAETPAEEAKEPPTEEKTETPAEEAAESKKAKKASKKAARKAAKKAKQAAWKELGGHLVTDEKGGKHLPTHVDGKPDPTHMGAAWAALHGGYRGNKYEGPDKEKAIAKLRKMYASMGRTPPGEDDGDSKSASKEFTTNFSIFKQADDTYRWMGVTSSGFRDRDHQLVTSDALRADVARMNKEQNFGETSFWHVMFKEENPATLDPGIALDIASCDVSEMVGDVSNLESGVFYDNEVGAKFCEKQGEFGFSREFFYPASEPDAQGNFNRIRTFRRTILPKERASNLMSAETLSIAKETKEGKMSRFAEIVGAAKAKEVSDAILAKEKALSAKGVEKKEKDSVKKESSMLHMHGDEKHSHDGGDAEHAHDGKVGKWKAVEPHAEPDADDRGGKSDDDADDKATKKEKREARFREIVGEELTAAFKEFAIEWNKAQGEQMAVAKKEQDDFKADYAALKAVVKELYGDAPNNLKSGFRASEAVQTMLKGDEKNELVKIVKKQVDPDAALKDAPMGEMFQWLAKSSTNGQ